MKKIIKIHRIVEYVITKIINNKDKVRDRCHITVKCRGAAHK